MVAESFTARTAGFFFIVPFILFLLSMSPQKIPIQSPSDQPLSQLPSYQDCDIVSAFQAADPGKTVSSSLGCGAMLLHVCKARKVLLLLKQNHLSGHLLEGSWQYSFFFPDL